MEVKVELVFEVDCNGILDLSGTWWKGGFGEPVRTAIKAGVVGRVPIVIKTNKGSVPQSTITEV